MCRWLIRWFRSRRASRIFRNIKRDFDPTIHQMYRMVENRIDLGDFYLFNSHKDWYCWLLKKFGFQKIEAGDVQTKWFYEVHTPDFRSIVYTSEGTFAEFDRFGEFAMFHSRQPEGSLHRPQGSNATPDVELGYGTIGG